MQTTTTPLNEIMTCDLNNLIMNSEPDDLKLMH